MWLLLDNNTYLSGLYELLIRRRDPEDQTEWADVVDYMNENGGNYNRDFVRKSWPLLSMYIDAGWVHQPESNEAKVSTKTAVSLNTDGTASSEKQFAVEENDDLGDPDFLLRAHGYDPSKFRLVQAKSSFWDCNGGDKKMCSSRITVAPKLSDVADEDIEDWLRKLVTDYKPMVKAPTYIHGHDKLLVIPISDLHHNLLATVFSSGNEYNCDLAESLFLRIISDVLDETKDAEFDRIILTIGGDQANADNINNTTTKGTPQDCELPYYDACEHLYAMTVEGIDLLKQYAPVDVVYVPGNHDRVTGFQLAKYLAAWFRGDDSVTVDYSPLPRKYKVWGKTLFVFAHDGDLKKLPQLIADEARNVWSRVEFTEVMLQHLHSEQVLMEQYHMRIQRIPSVVARSRWTVDGGYQARRQCKSFLYDKELGLRRVIYTPV